MNEKVNKLEENIINTIKAISEIKPEHFDDLDPLRKALINYLEEFRCHNDPDTFNVMYSYQIKRNITNPLIKHFFPFAEDKEQGYKMNFLVEHFDFVEKHIKHVIYTRTSITMCIEDQMRGVVSEYIKYLEKDKLPNWGTNRKWYLPKFGTEKDWMEFIESLYWLYKGEEDLYIKTKHSLLNDNQKVK